MYSLEKMCERVITSDYSYINAIYEDDYYYIFELSDIYGNTFDIDKKGINKFNGNIAIYNSYTEIDKRVEVPEKYKTYREKVKEILCCPITNKLVLDEEIIKKSVDLLFENEYLKLPLYDLYLVCVCFVKLIERYCENKGNLLEIEANPEIDAYLSYTVETKVKYAEYLGRGLKEFPLEIKRPTEYLSE